MPIILKGATSGQVTLDTPTIAGTNTITLPASTGTIQLLRLETAQNTTSGTSIDFLNIPSWAKKITVIFNGVSTNGTSNFLLQIGAGAIETSGYLGHVIAVQSTATSSGGNATTSGFPLTVSITGAADLYNGSVILLLLNTNMWVANTSIS